MRPGRGMDDSIWHVIEVRPAVGRPWIVERPPMGFHSAGSHSSIQVAGLPRQAGRARGSGCPRSGDAFEFRPFSNRYWWSNR